MALFSEKGHRSHSPPLAGKSTLNRLEHAPTEGSDRYHWIDHEPEALQALLVALFLQAHPNLPMRSFSISTPQVFDAYGQFESFGADPAQNEVVGCPVLRFLGVRRTAASAISAEHSRCDAGINPEWRAEFEAARKRSF